MNKFLIGLTMLSSLTSFATHEEVLNIKDYNNITVTSHCVKRTQPFPGLVGKRKISDFVIVTNLELKSNDEIIREINLFNYWTHDYEFADLEGCQKEVDNQASYFNSLLSSEANRLSMLFSKLKEQEILTFKRVTEYSCYRKELRLVNRPNSFNHYVHPLSGLKPQTVQEVRIVTPCIGNVILEP